jgi:hypothetical protein
MAEDRVAGHRAGETDVYVCEQCDTHRTMVVLDDARLWKPLGTSGYYASVDPGEVDPPIAPTLYRCHSCGWETTKPRRDTAPLADPSD